MAENPHGMLQLETKESILFAVHRGVPRSAELATIIEDNGGTVLSENKDYVQAHYLILSGNIQDLERVAALAAKRGVLPVDASWIWTSHTFKQLLPWYEFEIGESSSLGNCNADMRDLRELSRHLARYHPYGPPPQWVYLKLARKLPHLNSEKLKRLYEKYQPAVDAHVLDLLNQAAVSITLPIDENFFHRDQKIPGKSQFHSRSSSANITPGNGTFGIPKGAASTGTSTTASAHAASSLYRRIITNRHAVANSGDARDRKGDESGDGNSVMEVGRSLDKAPGNSENSVVSMRRLHLDTPFVVPASMAVSTNASPATCTDGEQVRSAH